MFSGGIIVLLWAVPLATALERAGEVSVPENVSSSSRSVPASSAAGQSLPLDPAPGRSLPSSSVIYLRMQAAITARSDGMGRQPISPDEIQRWVNDTNRSLSASRARIVLQWDRSQDLSTIDDNDLNFLDHSLSRRKRANEVAAQFPGKITVFFRTSGNGFAYSTDHFIAMPGNYWGTWVPTDYNPEKGDFEWVQNHAQLAHDLGHFLGLDHTFPGLGTEDLGSIRAVLRYAFARSSSTRDFDGDRISDTPPDLDAVLMKNNRVSFCNTPSGITVSQPDRPAEQAVFNGRSFTVVGNKIVPAGPLSPIVPVALTFSPRRDNVMSYYMCARPMKFTSGQVKKMRQELLTSPLRRHLICGNPSNGSLAASLCEGVVQQVPGAEVEQVQVPAAPLRAQRPLDVRLFRKPGFR